MPNEKRGGKGGKYTLHESKLLTLVRDELRFIPLLPMMALSAKCTKATMILGHADLLVKSFFPMTSMLHKRAIYILTPQH